MKMACFNYLAVMLLALCQIRAFAQQSQIHVDLRHPGPRVSPTLYGLFFEEINHAGDGGLYAEMVRNGSFEDSDKIEGWRAGNFGVKTLDTSLPLNPNNPTSLKLECHETKGASDEFSNGYWGFSVIRGSRYRISLYGRGTGSLVATLFKPDKRLSNLLILGKLTPDWKKYEGELTAVDTEPQAQLTVAVAGVGTAWIDQVSLMPEKTWKNHGLRTDLADKLDAIKPAFVRFPGGCFCEGEVLKDRFNWKDSIGPLEQRPGHWNLWGYRSTDHLGYHEYLQMCEDLGAEPLFVVNCGMSHREFAPLDKLDPYVQDALDAIEYANGPYESKWEIGRAHV